MSEIITKLRLKYGEVELEIESDSTTVAREREEFQKTLVSAIEVLSRKMLFQQPLPKTVEIIEPKSSEEQTKLIPCIDENSQKLYTSFNKLTKEKRFSTDVDRVIGAAYFLLKSFDKQEFTRDDILEQFKNAKLKTPSNISMCLTKNVEKAYIQQVGTAEKGMQIYSLLDDGITYCESYEPKEKATKTKKSNKISKSKPLKDYPSLLITIDNLHTEKYCDITKLKSFPEQLWVLMYMYTKETEYQIFEKQELQRIMKEKFRLPASDTQLRDFFRRAGVNADVTKVDGIQKIKLLQGGMQKAEHIIGSNQH